MRRGPLPVMGPVPKPVLRDPGQPVPALTDRQTGTRAGVDAANNGTTP